MTKVIASKIEAHMAQVVAGNILRATFTVKNITDSMWDQLKAMSSYDAFNKLRKWAYGDLKHLVSMKVGNGQLNKQIEFNSAFKSNKPMTMTIEPRKGYKLVTFEINT